MDTDKISLFIPAGLKAEREYFQGFAKRELTQAFFGSVGVLIATAIAYGISHTVLAVMGVLIIGEMAVISVVTRSPATNLSIVSQIQYAVRYLKEQQDYRYRQLREEDTYDTVYHE